MSFDLFKRNFYLFNHNLIMNGLLFEQNFCCLQSLKDCGMVHYNIRHGLTNMSASINIRPLWESKSYPLPL